MVKLDVYSKVDKELFRISHNLKPLFYSNPINIEAQKEQFLARKIDEPVFEYLPASQEDDPKIIEKELEKIKVPDGVLSNIYLEKVEEMKNLNNVVKYRGSEDVRDFSSKVYGLPLVETIEESKKLLKLEETNVEDEEVNIEEYVKGIRSALIRNNLNDWKVEIIESDHMVLMAEVKTVYVGKYAKFTKKNLIRLAFHEIAWHAVRAANGYNQKLKIFVMGFPKSHITEEGGALLFEKLSDTLKPNVLKSYAARAHSVIMMLRGKSFSQTFDSLRELEFDEDKAWSATLRAFRAGGLAKDHIYLQGMLEMNKFLSIGGDLKKLLVGQVGFRDIELLDQLIEDKSVRKALFIPDILEKNKTLNQF